MFSPSLMLYGCERTECATIAKAFGMSHAGHCKPTLSLSHLIDLLLVQVKYLSRGGGSNLLIDPVAGLRAVPTIPGQHKHHLGGKRGQGS